MQTLLDKKQVAELLHISTKTLDNWTAQGIGPTPIHLGPTLIRFTQAEIESFIQKSIGENK